MSGALLSCAFFVPTHTGSKGYRPFRSELSSCLPCLRLKEAIMEGKQFYLNITTLNEEGKKESKTIYVSEEVYRAYKQPYWKAKQQERRASRCIIDGHRCMGDCSKCDRLRDGAPLSLEQMAEDGIDVPSSYETPEEAALQKEEYEELYTAMATLTELDQKILWMMTDGKSDHAIAEALGMAQTTVSYRRRAALKNLKKLLG